MSNGGEQQEGGGCAEGIIGVAVECQEPECEKNNLFRVTISVHGTLLQCAKCGQTYGSRVALPLKMQKAIATRKGDPNANQQEKAPS